jgi:carbamoyl-phosphate synthase large subunit
MNQNRATRASSRFPQCRNVAPQALEKAGLATPKSMPIADVKDVDKAIEYLGLPIILKPIAGAGSLGVSRRQGNKTKR